MPQERPDDELRDAAPHVAHEIRMLEESWKHRTNRHAYVGWFVHCRTLMEFFGSKCPKHGDDICAWHFFDTETADGKTTWRGICCQLAPPSGYEAYRTAVNKLAAHLTYERVEIANEQRKDADHFTPSVEVTEYLLGLALLFFRTLPSERLGWFGALGML